MLKAQDDRAQAPCREQEGAGDRKPDSVGRRNVRAAISLAPLARNAPLARGATNTRNVSRWRGTAGAGRHSCSVLHRTGFILPLRSLVTRWALTPPFQPYLPKQAVYFLRHCPWQRTCVRRPRACARRAAPRCPDFPLHGSTAQRPPATRQNKTSLVRSLPQPRNARKKRLKPELETPVILHRPSAAAIRPRSQTSALSFASTQRPCSLIKSTRRSTASASGILNFTACLPK